MRNTIFLFVCFLAWGLSIMQLWLSWNSHLNSQVSTCICLQNAETNGMCHYAWLVVVLNIYFYLCLSVCDCLQRHQLPL